MEKLEDYEVIIYVLSFFLSCVIFVYGYYLKWKHITDKKALSKLKFLFVSGLLFCVNIFLYTICIPLVELIGKFSLFIPILSSLGYLGNIQNNIDEGKYKASDSLNQNKDTKKYSELKSKEIINTKNVRKNKSNIKRDNKNESNDVVLSPDKIIENDQISKDSKTNNQTKSNSKSIGVGDVIKFDFYDYSGNSSLKTVKIEKIDSDRIHGTDLIKLETSSFLFERMGMEIVEGESGETFEKTVLFSDKTPLVSYFVNKE